MKHKLLFTCLGILLSCCLFSCTKYRLDRKEDKLIGDWIFEDVRKGSWPNRQSVIHRWQMYTVTFQHNGQTVWHNAETGESLAGTWSLSEVNDAGNQLTIIDIALRDTSDHLYMYSWDIHQLTRQKLNCYEPADKPRDQMYYYLRRR